MRKLTPKDITIKTSGQLVKDAVLEHLKVNRNQSNRVISRHLCEFAVKLDLDPRSFKNYMQSTKKYVGSAKFRTKLAIILDKGYDEITPGEDGQIERLVRAVCDNIGAYSEDEDIQTLEKLRSLCQEKNKVRFLAQVYWTIGQYYLTRKNKVKSSAIASMERAIATAEEEFDLLMYYCSELGSIYFNDKEHIQAKSLYDKADALLEALAQVDDKILFLHYYRYGIFYSNLGELEKAKSNFKKALQYARTNFHILRSLMNIGICFKKIGCYQDALRYYEKALEVAEMEDTKSQGIVYNNIAELFRVQEDYDTALDYIEKAFQHFAVKDEKERLASSITYVQINTAKGEPGKGLDRLMHSLSNSEDISVYKNFIIDGLNAVFQCCVNNEDMDLLKQLKADVRKLIGNAANSKEYKKDLKAVLCDIHEFFDKRGEKDNEKTG